MRKKGNVLSISLVFLLLVAMAPAVAGSALLEAQGNFLGKEGFADSRSTVPNLRPLTSLEEVLEWHGAPMVWGDFPVLGNDILVDRSITLSETADAKELGAIEHALRVTAGGSLTLDNPKLVIQGPGSVIVVEPGGELLLQQGAIYTGPGDAIVVEEGGTLVKAEGFLIDGGTIHDKNEPPTEPEPSPTPAPPEEKPAILGVMSPAFALSCLVGQPPAASAYPLAAWIHYKTADQIPVQRELPVQWAVDTVDFGTPGTYPVKGMFTQEVLEEYGLRNPDQFSATLQLTVVKPSPIEGLTGNVLSIGSTGLCHVRLAMPPLPEGVTALYVYRSADGINWTKAVQENTVGGIPYDDFWPGAQSTPTKLYVSYRYQTDYLPIWLRVELVGSAAAGTSNAIKLEMPASAKPGDSIHTGETGDDGGSGGNRGGGGQSAGDRDLPNVSGGSGQGGTTLPAGATPKPSSKSTPASGDTMTGAAVGQDQKEGGAQSASSGSPGTSPGSTGSQANQEEQEGALAAGGEGLPFQTSRGVLLTAGATAVLGVGILLLRKYRSTKKRKH